MKTILNKNQIKTANALISFAKDHGFTIGRKSSGRYYYGQSNGNVYSEGEFTGTWNEFVKFFIQIVERS